MEEEIASTAAGASDQASRLGLETLPELVLLMIFKMLPLSDRAYLGSACKRFHSLMYYPSVWRDIGIRTTLQEGYSVFHGRVEAAGLCESDKFMIKKFDKYLQNVSVYINSWFLKYSLFNMLRELARKRNLKRLVFLGAQTVQEPASTTSLLVVNDLLASVTKFLYTLDPETMDIKIHLVLDNNGESYETLSANPLATQFRHLWTIQRRLLGMTLNQTEIRTQDVYSTIKYVANNPLGRPNMTFEFFENNYEHFKNSLGGWFLARVLEYATEHFNTEDELRKLQRFSEGRNVTVIRSVLDKVIAQTGSNIVWLRHKLDAFRDWLTSTDTSPASVSSSSSTPGARSYSGRF